jgi:hypothetical protein
MYIIESRVPLILYRTGAQKLLYSEQMFLCIRHIVYVRLV